MERTRKPRGVKHQELQRTLAWAAAEDRSSQDTDQCC